MKRNFIVIGMAAAALLAACKNDNSVNPQPTLGKATITGKLFAETNAKNPGYEAVPAGTKVVVIVNSKDLAITPDLSRRYAERYYEGQTDGNGNYSVDVDVAAKEITVSLVTGDFKTNVTKFDGSVNFDEVFNGSAHPVSIYAKGVFLVNVTY